MRLGIPSLRACILVTLTAIRVLGGDPWNMTQIMDESVPSVNLLWNPDLRSDAPGQKWLRNHVDLGTLKPSEL